MEKTNSFNNLKEALTDYAQDKKRKQERALRLRMLRITFFSLLCALLAITVVIGILLGIWWEPYPFWKVFVTQLILIAICNSFTE